VYSPYGEVVASDHFAMHNHLMSPAGFKGLFFDRLVTRADYPPLTPGADGVYQNRNRSYIPRLGRFAQRDPNATAMPLIDAANHSGATIETPFDSYSLETHYFDGMNLFASMGSNPVSRRDVLGLFWGEQEGNEDGLLVRRDWDAIYDSITGHGSAYLGVQGAATFGSFWGGNVAVLPRMSTHMMGVSQGVSDYADFYAEQVINLPFEAAMGGLGGFAKIANVAQDANTIARGSRFVAAGAKTVGFARRVSSGPLKDAFRAAANFRIPWGQWRHILERHHWKSIYDKVGRFFGGSNIKGMIRQALSSPNSAVRPNPHKNVGGWLFDLTFERPIGVSRDGISTRTIRVILTETGEVWTAFPL
jgi:hypothetical protein